MEELDIAFQQTSSKPSCSDSDNGEELTDMQEMINSPLRNFDFDEESIPEPSVVRSVRPRQDTLSSVFVEDSASCFEDLDSMISGESTDTRCDTESSSEIDEINANDHDEDAILFFNYNSDGSNYSPIRSPINMNKDKVKQCGRNQKIRRQLEYDSEEEELDVLKNLCRETGHEKCECATLKDYDYGTYPRLRTNQENVTDIIFKSL